MKDAARDMDRRLQFGLALYRSDVVELFEVSSHTVEVWRENGLKFFRPATGGNMCLVSDLREFLSARPELKGRVKRRKAV